MVSQLFAAHSLPSILALALSQLLLQLLLDLLFSPYLQKRVLKFIGAGSYCNFSIF